MHTKYHIVLFQDIESIVHFYILHILYVPSTNKITEYILKIKNITTHYTLLYYYIL